MKAPFKLLYNNDNTNVAALTSPWHEEGERFRPEYLAASIEETAAFGVDAYMLSPGLGWVPWWQSSLEPGFFDGWRARTGLEVEGVGGLGCERYVAGGGDMVKVLVDTCRRCNMAPFVSLRINDVHHQEHYNARNQQSLVSCRFYSEHPEWHIDPEHPKKAGYCKQRGMNWAVPQVRDYRVAQIRELADHYDLAGLELDFLRDDTLFRNDMPEADRIEIVTDFIRRARAVLDARPAPRRWLCVRIPQRLASLAQTGLDIERLRDAGVDMFNLSGWFHTTQRADIAEVRRRAPEAAIYQELTQSTGAHRYFIDNPLYGCDGDPKTSDHQLYTTARLAKAQGADGLSLFNFAYYRSGSRPKDLPEMEPPFHVLPKFNDTEYLARQHAYYWLAATYYFGQLPRTIEPAKVETFQVDMGKPRLSNEGAYPARLRLHLREACPESLQLGVAFNGRALEPTPDVSRFFGNPFDGMISPPSHRRAWVLPRAAIADGRNEVVVTTGEARVQVIYLDCGVPR
jgi:hypothetical protein